MRLVNPGLRQLLLDLKGPSSFMKFGEELGVSGTTVNEWCKREDVSIQTEHMDAILSLARARGIEPMFYQDPPQLWDITKSYEENQKLRVPEPLSRRAPTDKIQSVFLGRAINSPVGATSTILTSSDARVAFLASADIDVITYKTVRSGFYRAHKKPNIYVYERDGILDPDQPMPQIVVTDAADASEPNRVRGFVNRFGVPSKAAEEWQADFATAKTALQPGQLLILSVMGTAGKEDSAQVLIDDFVKVVTLAIDAGAEIIELNLSCPNCQGREGELFRDLELTKKILRAVRAVAPSAEISLLAKIGYMPANDLETFVLETAEYVDGYTAINSIPVEAVADGQYGPVLVYPPAGTKSGLTGKPIKAYALRTVRSLNELRMRENLSYWISGCGGVTEPEDVTTFLQSGADIVQIGTKLIMDSIFGLRVRQHLENQPAQFVRSPKESVRMARLNWYHACQSIAGLEESEIGMIEAEKVFFGWREPYLRNSERAYRSDNRFRSGVPSKAEFVRLIRAATRR